MGDSCSSAMQSLYLPLLLSSLASLTASPLPQAEDKPVVLLVQPITFQDVFTGFPDLGGFSGFSSFPSFSGIDDIPHPPQIQLKDIFGADNEQPLNPVGSDCGLICKVFKSLEGQLGVFEDDDGVVRAPVISEQEDIEGKYDNHTLTYDEQVLPDGSTIRINKTVIQDTDDEGNHFFFQSSVHHLVKEDEDNSFEVDAGIQEDVVEDEAKDDDDALSFVAEDPILNEVLDEKFPTANVEDLFE